MNAIPVERTGPQIDNETYGRCYACDRRLSSRREPDLVDTRDSQLVYVGPDCFKKIVAAGEAGYQPPKGGPRLYLARFYGDAP